MQSLISELTTIIAGQLANPMMGVLATIALVAVGTGAAARIVVRVEDFLHAPPCQSQP
ncbi:MAG: hypothetical protein ACR2OI_13005 [Acidimicrobiia bacterium]